MGGSVAAASSALGPATRRRVLLAAPWLLILALGVWAFWIEPASLRVREYGIELPRWPEGLSGLKVAVLADLHVGSPFNGEAKLRRVVRETNAAKPDLIVLAGDFVIRDVLGGRFVPPEKIAAELARLQAPLGRYAVLGNHDWWFSGARVRTALEEKGIPVLDERAVRLDAPGGSFWLCGFGDFWEGRHDVAAALAAVDDDRPVLGMTHNPDLFAALTPRVDLLLAGHTHGGQVWLPLIGRPIVPSAYGQRYAIGPIVEGGRHLFVTPGIGTSIIPVRFMVPPEISLLTLRASRDTIGR